MNSKELTAILEKIKQNKYGPNIHFQKCNNVKDEDIQKIIDQFSKNAAAAKSITHISLAGLKLKEKINLRPFVNLLSIDLSGNNIENQVIPESCENIKFVNLRDNTLSDEYVIILKFIDKSWCVILDEKYDDILNKNNFTCSSYNQDEEISNEDDQSEDDHSNDDEEQNLDDALKQKITTKTSDRKVDKIISNVHEVVMPGYKLPYIDKIVKSYYLINELYSNKNNDDFDGKIYEVAADFAALIFNCAKYYLRIAGKKISVDTLSRNVEKVDDNVKLIFSALTIFEIVKSFSEKMDECIDEFEYCLIKEELGKYLKCAESIEEVLIQLPLVSQKLLDLKSKKSFKIENKFPKKHFLKCMRYGIKFKKIIENIVVDKIYNYIPSTTRKCDIYFDVNDVLTGNSNNLPLGAAVLTGGGALDKKNIYNVIHVAPALSGDTDVRLDNIDKCIENAIKLASMNDLKQLVFIKIGGGTFFENINFEPMIKEMIDLRVCSCLGYLSYRILKKAIDVNKTLKPDANIDNLIFLDFDDYDSVDNYFSSARDIYFKKNDSKLNFTVTISKKSILEINNDNIYDNLAIINPYRCNIEGFKHAEGVSGLIARASLCPDKIEEHICNIWRAKYNISLSSAPVMSDLQNTSFNSSVNKINNSKRLSNHKIDQYLLNILLGSAPVMTDLQNTSFNNSVNKINKSKQLKNNKFEERLCAISRNKYNISQSSAPVMTDLQNTSVINSVNKINNLKQLNNNKLENRLCAISRDKYNISQSSALAMTDLQNTSFNNIVNNINNTKQLSNDKLEVCNTLIDGNSAFHVIFGKNIDGVYKCENLVEVQELRNKVANSIENAYLIDKEHFECVRESVRTILMDNRDISDYPSLMAAREKMQSFSHENNKMMDNLWSALEILIGNNDDFKNFIIEHASNECKNRLRDAYSSCKDSLKGEDLETLNKFITNTQGLKFVISQIGEYSKKEFKFDRIITKDLLKEYAAIMRSNSHWLMSCELGIIAYLFNKSIKCYTTINGTKDKVDDYNCKLYMKPIEIRFDGVNHYSRIENRSFSHGKLGINTTSSMLDKYMNSSSGTKKRDKDEDDNDNQVRNKFSNSKKMDEYPGEDEYSDTRAKLKEYSACAIKIEEDLLKSPRVSQQLLDLKSSKFFNLENKFPKEEFLNCIEYGINFERRIVNSTVEEVYNYIPNTTRVCDIYIDDNDVVDKNFNLLPLGAAVLTGGGALAEKNIHNVIHVAPASSGDDFVKLDKIDKCIENAIKLASKNAFKQLAFVKIGGGIFFERIDFDVNFEEVSALGVGSYPGYLAYRILNKAIEVNKDLDPGANIDALIFLDYGYRDSYFKDVYNKYFKETSSSLNFKIIIANESILEINKDDIYDNLAIINPYRCNIAGLRHAGGVSGLIAKASRCPDKIEEHIRTILQNKYAMLTSSSYIMNDLQDATFNDSANKINNANRFNNDTLKICNTLADGNCAFHAIFGDNLNGVYQCNPYGAAEKYRSMVAASIQVCDETMKEHFECVRESIRAILMESTDISSSPLLMAAREKMQEFNKANNQKLDNLWLDLEMRIECNDNFKGFILERASDECRNRLRDAYSSCKNALNGEDLEKLKEFIKNTEGLGFVISQIEEHSNNEFDFNSIINTNLLKEYANIMRSNTHWLVSCELGIIAYLYNIHIQYYITINEALYHIESYNMGGNGDPIKIHYNGSNHYSRIEKISNSYDTLGRNTTTFMIDQYKRYQQNINSSSVINKRARDDDDNDDELGFKFSRLS